MTKVVVSILSRFKTTPASHNASVTRWSDMKGLFSPLFWQTRLVTVGESLNQKHRQDRHLIHSMDYQCVFQPGGCSPRWGCLEIEIGSHEMWRKKKITDKTIFTTNYYFYFLKFWLKTLHHLDWRRRSCDNYYSPGTLFTLWTEERTWDWELFVGNVLNGHKGKKSMLQKTLFVYVVNLRKSEWGKKYYR